MKKIMILCAIILTLSLESRCQSSQGVLLPKSEYDALVSQRDKFRDQSNYLGKRVLCLNDSVNKYKVKSIEQKLSIADLEHKIESQDRLLQNALAEKQRMKVSYDAMVIERNTCRQHLSMYREKKRRKPEVDGNGFQIKKGSFGY